MLRIKFQRCVSRRLNLLSALCLAASSLPAQGALGPTSDSAFARSVELRKKDSLDLSSFLTRRPAAEAGAPGEALLGVRARSDLAEAPGNALFEYSVAVADGGEGDEISEAERRLLSLRIDSQWRSVDYALRLFSVGDGYGRSAPAREHLGALGLPGAGRGAELSAGWELLDVQLRPRVRRVTRDEGSARRIEDAHSLHLSRALLDDLDLAAHFETRSGRLLGQGAETVLDTRVADRAHVALSGSGWRLFWTELDRDHRPSGAASGESADSTELGLRIDVPGALSLAPRYRLDRSSTGTADTELTTGRLAISASLPVVRALDVELEYRDRRELGADASGFAAVLKMRRPLALAERLPQGVMLDASVSWRESDATGRALWQDGFGGQIALEYRRSIPR